MLPSMQLVQLRFAATSSAFSADEQKAARKQLLDIIVAQHMSDYYSELCDKGVLERNQETLSKMQKHNEARLIELDAAIADAVENLGESEVRDAHLRKAEHWLTVGNKVSDCVWCIFVKLCCGCGAVCLVFVAPLNRSVWQSRVGALLTANDVGRSRASI